MVAAAFGLIGIGFFLFGILGIVDSLMMRGKPADGKASAGRMVWSILMLVLAGVSALPGVALFVLALSKLGDSVEEGWDAFGVGWTFCWLLMLSYCLLLMLASINRLRAKPPGLVVPRLVIGILLAIIGFGWLAFLVTGGELQ